MKAGIKTVDIMRVDLPFKNKFKHSIASRGWSDSIFVKLILDDGTVGYGESLPREYVTGETAGSVFDSLKRAARQGVAGYGIGSYEEAPSFIDGIGIEKSATRCALELAVLDAYGRYFNSPVSSIIGKRARQEVFYSGVMQAGSRMDALKKSLLFKLYGFKHVKVKVGSGDDIGRLGIARRILGKSVDIRVDANCAWNADQAIESIGKMRRFGVSAVEQPVSPYDYKELKKVTNGGLINSLRIANIARRHNIGVQIGCQVGESGLLSAAGWHLASMLNDASFCEGAYGRYLLKEDITEEDMTIKRSGALDAVYGPGLGVNIIEPILNKYITRRESVNA
jgi:muconate cycloisomerase